MKKTLIMTVVLIVGMLGIVYGVNKLQNKTLSYKNSKYGYTIQYPSGYETRAFNEAGGDVESKNDSTSVGLKKNGENNFVFYVSESSLPEFSDVGIKNYFASAGPANVSVSAVQVAGKPGIMAQIQNDANVVSDYLFVQGNDQKILQLTVAKNNPDAEAMVNSFTFSN